MTSSDWSRGPEPGESETTAVFVFLAHIMADGASCILIAIQIRELNLHTVTPIARSYAALKPH